MMKKFKITAPFTSIEEIEPLKEAGVDELYCGYIDEESEKLWPIAFCTMNRRGKGCSFEQYTVFKAAVAKAEAYDLPVYVAMNGLYTLEQYPWLLKTIHKISRLSGVKGIIIADMGLLLSLRREGYQKEIHISTGGTIFNHYTADFFSSLGASRVILDRQLAADEMVELISQRKSNIEVEIFMVNEPCLFIDGYCAFFHHFDKDERSRVFKVTNKTSVTTSYCSFPTVNGCEEIRKLLLAKKFEVHPIAGGKTSMEPLGRHVLEFGLNCNLCSLYKLRSFSGIRLKITGRVGNQARPVNMVSRAIKIAGRKTVSRKQYEEKAKALRFDYHKKKCDLSSCYCSKSLTRRP